MSKWRALRLAAKMRVHRGGDAPHAPHAPLTTPSSSSASPAAAAPVAGVGGLQSHIDAPL